jgi:hypothetical protein
MSTLPTAYAACLQVDEWEELPGTRVTLNYAFFWISAGAMYCRAILCAFVVLLYTRCLPLPLELDCRYHRPLAAAAGAWMPAVRLGVFRRRVPAVLWQPCVPLYARLFVPPCRAEPSIVRTA